MAALVGLPFPLIMNGKGGISTGRQGANDTGLLDGKIEQILGTNIGERSMESDVFGGLDTYVFEPSDASTRTLLEYEIKHALKHIPEISVTSVNVYNIKNTIYAKVSYKDVVFNTTQTSTVKVGDMNED